MVKLSTRIVGSGEHNVSFWFRNLKKSGGVSLNLLFEIYCRNLLSS